MVSILVHDSKATLASTLCAKVVSLSLTSISHHDSFTLALSGGSIPSMLSPSNMGAAFQALSATPDYSKWHIILADERVVPPTHADSNLLALQTASFAGACPNLYAISETGSVSEIAADYSQIVTNTLSLSGGVFDCVVLGMGEDGHTCSLFPSHPITARSLATSPPPPVVDFLTDSPKQPPTRVTLTLPTLNASRTVLFAAAGAGKADVLSKVFVKTGEVEGGFTADKVVGATFPCGLVEGGELLWLVDQGAVSTL